VQSSLAACQAFFQWWIGELAGCLPKSWSVRSPWGRSEFVLIPQAQELILGRDRGDGRLEVLQRFLVRDGKPMPQTLPDPIEARLNRASSMTLRLPAELGLRKTIRLPLATLENLRESVAFQLDRHTPFSQDDAYFDCTLLQRDDAAGQLAVEATVVARGVVSAACATAERLGWRISAVEIMRDETAGDKSPTRLTVPDLRRKPRAQLALTAAAIVLLILLAGVAALFPVTAAQLQERELAQQLDAARHQAEAAASLDKQNQELKREANFLAGRLKAHPSALDILLELTKLTPNETSLDTAQYTGTQIQFSGVSNSASALIGRFAQSSVFRNMEFRSPVTPDPRNGRERFQISGQLQAQPDKP
jgi:general secretion pathway protein L